MLDTILNVDGEEGQSIPLIVDSPHSGVIYPSDFNHQAEFSKLRQAEDSYVDELYNYAGWDVNEYKALQETFDESEYKYRAFEGVGCQVVIQLINKK